MLAVVVAEGLVIAKHKGTVSWQELVFNLNSGHIMLWLFRGLEIFCYGFVVTHYSFNLVENWPTALVWCLRFLLGTLALLATPFTPYLPCFMGRSWYITKGSTITYH